MEAVAGSGQRCSSRDWDAEQDAGTLLCPRSRQNGAGTKNAMTKADTCPSDLPGASQLCEAATQAASPPAVRARAATPQPALAQGLSHQPPPAAAPLPVSARARQGTNPAPAGLCPGNTELPLAWLWQAWSMNPRRRRLQKCLTKGCGTVRRCKGGRRMAKDGSRGC